jgi:hypothetical protein
VLLRGNPNRADRQIEQYTGTHDPHEQSLYPYFWPGASTTPCVAARRQRRVSGVPPRFLPPSVR